MKTINLSISIFCVALLAACQPTVTPDPTITPTKPIAIPATKSPTPQASPTLEEIVFKQPLVASIILGEQNIENDIRLDSGGDVDTVAVQINGVEARQSGNGTPLVSPDDNDVPDYFTQFNLDDNLMFAGQPTRHVRVEVDYLDQGTDTFSLQYDASPILGFDGRFASGGGVAKTDSGEWKTAIFNLCDAYFANRDNGADFRIGDDGNGAVIIREVRVIGLESGITTWLVDDYGANPWDDQPDSDAIQMVLDSTCSGDTIFFTSGVNTDGYQGYLIDKTLFLTGMTAKHDLTFTASDPDNHALLRATSDLKGFVVQLYARSRFHPNQNIYNIDFGFIDVHGGREVRVCKGPDGIQDGVDDNWGSWLPECEIFGDPWCTSGNISFDGFWENVVIHDLVSQQGECGTGLAFMAEGGTGNTIRKVTIDTVGDHTHAQGCAFTDDDGDEGAWSDGITAYGANLLITNNTIINPSDIAIVTFGGANTIISDNTVIITPGNYGAFAGIAAGGAALGRESAGVQVIGNTLINEGDSDCGGLHVGIYVGLHLWFGGCFDESHEIDETGDIYYGNPTCSGDPDPDTVAPCTGGTCQIWAVLSEGDTLTWKDNIVIGAHINYLVQGFLIKGEFIDENNISIDPRQTDWEAAKYGCNGITWGPLDKVAHNPSLPGYTDLIVHCER